MNCYDAFSEIVDDFKSLLDRRESAVRNVEESLSRNLRSEADVVRRLEQQIEQLRAFLVEQQHTSNGLTCSRCQQSVHEQFSQDLRRHLYPRSSVYGPAAATLRSAEKRRTEEERPESNLARRVMIGNSSRPTTTVEETKVGRTPSPLLKSMGNLGDGLH